MSLQQVRRLAGPALTLGGLLWILIYVFIAILGVQTGKLMTVHGPHAPLLARIGIWLLPLSVFPLGVGLLGVFARLNGRARGLGITGIVFAFLGMVMAAINLVLLSGITGSSTYIDSLGGFAAFATVIGTAFLGWAALRTSTLPRWSAWTLIVVGIATIPILFVTPLPVGPDWATDMLAFLLSGIAYTVVGIALLAEWKATREFATDISAQRVAQVK